MLANVLVVGSGGREHALSWKLRQSSAVGKVFSVPENATEFSANGITSLDDVEAVKNFCKYNQIDLVIIGPEQQICEGWTEKLGSVTKVFAPSINAGIIESSKSFSKSFMDRHGIPTASFKMFTDPDKAVQFIGGSKQSKFVIKEDGLRAGKGVYICGSVGTALAKIRALSVNIHSPVVIEEFLEGFEVSALCFTDGDSIKMMPFSQDHKRALDGDRGDNTGGMGAVAPVFLTKQLQDEIEAILKTTVDGLKEEGKEYRGVLYAGVMITEAGPKVLEYNCRFGDPETQVLMRLLESDLYLICQACCMKTLSQIAVQWSTDCAIGVVVASRGYPNAFEKGAVVSNLPADDANLVTFYAGIRRDEASQLVNSGGRVLCVTCTGKSFYEVRQRVYSAVEGISFELSSYRRDIGHFVLSTRKPFSYQQAGVDIGAGNALVDRIKASCKATLTPGTGEIGGFGAVVDLKAAGFQDPLLVLGMDGVGTKIEIASKMGEFSGLGYDLVGMCANDVVCHGASPVAFLDYYVTGKLDTDKAAAVIQSIASACTDCGCALVGGETAEMPGVYAPSQWDLAGCCVGVKERGLGAFPKVDEIKEGDVLLGLHSSGLHSNGFSLVRALFEKNGIKLTDPCPWDENIDFGTELLKPTLLYTPVLLPMIHRHLLKACAHITGGGLVENVPRVLPKHLAARIDCSSWDIAPIFKYLQKLGAVDPLELFKTLNCGIGMVVVVDKEQAAAIASKMTALQRVSVIGKIEKLTTERVILDNSDAVFDFSRSVLRTRRANVAILISGTGTNAVNLIEQATQPLSRCSIRLVISNKPEAKGLEAARARGVEALCIPHGVDREVFEQQMHQELIRRKIDFVCLAGFMRILTPWFLNEWADRVINIHPSLLPAFKGAHAVRDALAAGVKVTGCTAHFVTEEVDAGKIIAQQVVLVEETDTEDSLHLKIQQKEYSIFPQVMETVAAQILGD